jgi:hypothetical protein
VRTDSNVSLLARRSCALMAATMLAVATASAATGSGRRINAPYFQGSVRYAEAAVAWFGKVDAQKNYADVRVGYTDTELWVNVAIFDQWLWEDDAASRQPASLEQWDAVTLLLHRGATSDTPSSGTSRFVAELNWWRPRTDYQAAYVGNGTGWTLAPATGFSTEAGWRGDAPNSTGADRGWTATFHIPFSALGLSGPPAPGTVWGLGFQVHDKDSAGVPAVVDSFWPETLTRDRPSTYGQLAFGLPTYSPPAGTSPTQTITIRHNLNGSVVNDAMVGGGSSCGTGSYFDVWGGLNYAGSTSLVVQNQSDVADWPCFSKMLFEFPLSALPAGKAIVSATLTVYQFGNSDPTQAQRSLVQVLAIDEAWNEATVSWNTAPLAAENVSQSWVDPLPGGPIVWPGTARTWDVSRAVAQSYGAQRGTIRLALYEGDAAYHSGKYFTSSDTGEWNAVGRPTLTIVVRDATTTAPSRPTGLRIVGY